MESASVVLDALPLSVRQARALAGSRCRASGMDPSTCDLVVLLTSELVTNAILHASSRARMTITTTASAIRVEVGDDSPEQPRVLHLGSSAPHGRGMAMVAALASDWGVREVPGGKVVWFTVAADQRAA